MKWRKKTPIPVAVISAANAQISIERKLIELQNRIDNVAVIVSAIASDKRLERMETLLNSLVADVRIGRYCSFRGTDWDKAGKK